MSETQPRSYLQVVRDGAAAPELPLPAPGTEPRQQPGTDLEPRPAPELERDIVDGEIVEDPTTLPGPRPQRPLAARPIRPIRPIRAIAVRLDERAPIVHGAVETTVTIAQGWHSWMTRAWDGLTLGVHRRQIRIAEATGDMAALAEWLERKQQAAAQRHARLMDLPKLAFGLVKAAVIGLVSFLVLMSMLSIAVWATGVGSFGAVWAWVGGVIRLVLTVVAVAWPAFTVAAPVAVLVAAWREGRRRGADTPQDWVTAADDEGDPRDVIPDENSILNALRNLGIPELNRAFKAGWKPRIPMPTHRDGKGYRTQIELPSGVPVEKIVKKKPVLAHNLVRFPIEVWPTEPKPGVLDLWVANPGALSGPVPPWPLLNAGAGDYFEGIPVAVNIRGKTITTLLCETNHAYAGRMGSGKSSLIITELLGALLDPLVEADVFAMAVNSDYDPMKPRLRTLLTGTGDEVVEACLNTLREAYDDLDVRGRALKEHDIRAVNRSLAEKDARLRPRVIVVDECQALFMHEEYGEEAISLSVKLMGAARKYAVTMIFATPEPSSASLPRKLMAVMSNKACFAIGDQTSNDAILGTGAYKAGISAVGLKPKTKESNGDVGTCVADGFEADPGLLRCYFVSVAEAHAVIERAMEIRRKAGITSGKVAPVEERDVIDDLDEVLGSEKTRLSDVASLLRALAPTWRPYQTLTGTELRDILTREHGIKVTNSGNVLRLDPADLRRFKALREAGE